ncbi:MAG: putative peptide maturation dehydrogenase [Solirubrobacteraceae bacterium]
MLAGGELPLTRYEADALLAVPADRWIAATDAGDTPLVRRFLDAGLLIGDTGDGPTEELRRRDQRLSSPPWNPYAALFHSLTRWRDVAVRLAEPPSPDSPRRKVRWRPPDHFYHVDAPSTVALPLIERDGPLYDLLQRRKTTRGFDESAFLSLEELSVLLRTVWGAQGVLWLSEALSIVKKTSPSGGSQHPVEVYPLLRAVDGVEPGLYHYDAERHELGVLELLSAEQAGELIIEFTAGQPHYAKAQSVFLMTARFARNHWKYPAHAKSFRVLLMDAAHLSQTFYLVCTELGLGAFVTGAINDENIDRRLRLERFAEDVLLIVGCGRVAPSEREPRYEPFTPRAR